MCEPWSRDIIILGSVFAQEVLRKWEWDGVQRGRCFRRDLQSSLMCCGGEVGRSVVVCDCFSVLLFFRS